jgi:hypothetical protein
MVGKAVSSTWSTVTGARGEIELNPFLTNEGALDWLHRAAAWPVAADSASAAVGFVVIPVSEQVRPMNRAEFDEFLTTTGFISAGELTEVERQLPPAETTDVQALARLLVQKGKLTKYQAATPSALRNW